ncbi:hypothetical protein DDE82_005140 [Stemphylium lycopersici]|nr:hypothetical protein DDE82_005140 [Stemphylium lycopersici]
MDFPHMQLQTSLAATMFSPYVVSTLYTQPEDSQQSKNRNTNPTNTYCKRNIRGNTSDDGSEQRQRLGKSGSIRNLGRLFRRKRCDRGSINGSVELATIHGSDHEEDTASIKTVRRYPPGSLKRSESVDNRVGESTIDETDTTDHEEAPEELHQLRALSDEECAAFAKAYMTFNDDDDNNDSNQKCNDNEVDERSGEDHTSDSKKGEDYVSKDNSLYRYHQEYLHVNLTEEDVKRIAGEIKDETIAEVNLSLFSYWIKSSDENYTAARKEIRELGLDHGYNLMRIRNEHLRRLLEDVFNQRPVEPRATLLEKRFRVNLAASAAHAPPRSSHYRVLPRLDSLPSPMRAERLRVITKDTIRSTSSSSFASSQRDYPPNTPDRPLPLSFRTPSSTPGSLPSLPFGFPSPGSPVRHSVDNFSALESYTGSSDDETDIDSAWETRVASVYERVVALQGPEQLDEVIEGLQGLRAMYLSEEA